MKTKRIKHSPPPKGWTLVQWANQCWFSQPAPLKQATDKQVFITALLRQYRGLETVAGLHPLPIPTTPVPES